MGPNSQMAVYGNPLGSGSRSLGFEALRFKCVGLIAESFRFRAE